MKTAFKIIYFQLFFIFREKVECLQSGGQKQRSQRKIPPSTFHSHGEIASMFIGFLAEGTSYSSLAIKNNCHVV